MALYGDRTHAGRVLAFALRGYAGRSDVVVLGLPRGGVVVADEVARALDAPLELPGTSASLSDKIVIVVDDGLDDARRMRSAVLRAQQLDPRRVVVALPVGDEAALAELRRDADDVVCFATPDPFQATSLWYVDFPEVTDAEVRRLLEAPRDEQSASSARRPAARPRRQGGAMG